MAMAATRRHFLRALGAATLMAAASPVIAACDVLERYVEEEYNLAARYRFNPRSFELANGNWSVDVLERQNGGGDFIVKAYDVFGVEGLEDRVRWGLMGYSDLDKRKLVLERALLVYVSPVTNEIMGYEVHYFNPAGERSEFYDNNDRRVGRIPGSSGLAELGKTAENLYSLFWAAVTKYKTEGSNLSEPLPVPSLS